MENTSSGAKDEDSDLEYLYEDLPDNQFDLLRKVNEALKLQVCKLGKKVEELTNANIKLTNVERALSRNISVLFTTATAQIEHKDRMIAELRKERDSLLFRRFKNLADYSTSAGICESSISMKDPPKIQGESTNKLKSSSQISVGTFQASKNEVIEGITRLPKTTPSSSNVCNKAKTYTSSDNVKPSEEKCGSVKTQESSVSVTKASSDTLNADAVLVDNDLNPNSNEHSCSKTISVKLTKLVIPVKTINENVINKVQQKVGNKWSSKLHLSNRVRNKYKQNCVKTNTNKVKSITSTILTESQKAEHERKILKLKEESKTVLKSMLRHGLKKSPIKFTKDNFRIPKATPESAKDNLLSPKVLKTETTIMTDICSPTLESHVDVSMPSITDCSSGQKRRVLAQIIESDDDSSSESGNSEENLKESCEENKVPALMPEEEYTVVSSIKLENEEEYTVASSIKLENEELSNIETSCLPQNETGKMFTVSTNNKNLVTENQYCETKVKIETDSSNLNILLPTTLSRTLVMSNISCEPEVNAVKSETSKHMLPAENSETDVSKIQAAPMEIPRPEFNKTSKNLKSESSSLRETTVKHNLTHRLNLKHLFGEDYDSESNEERSPSPRCKARSSRDQQQSPKHRRSCSPKNEVKFTKGRLRSRSPRNKLSSSRDQLRSRSPRNEIRSSRDLLRSRSPRNELSSSRGRPRSRSPRNELRSSRDQPRSRSPRNELNSSRDRPRSRSPRNEIRSSRDRPRSRSPRNEIRSSRGRPRSRSPRNEIRSSRDQPRSHSPRNKIRYSKGRPRFGLPRNEVRSSCSVRSKASFSKDRLRHNSPRNYIQSVSVGCEANPSSDRKISSSDDKHIQTSSNRHTHPSKSLTPDANSESISPSITSSRKSSDLNIKSLTVKKHRTLSSEVQSASRNIQAGLHPNACKFTPNRGKSQCSDVNRLSPCSNENETCVQHRTKSTSTQHMNRSPSPRDKNRANSSRISERCKLENNEFENPRSGQISMNKHEGHHCSPPLENLSESRDSAFTDAKHFDHNSQLLHDRISNDENWSHHSQDHVSTLNHISYNNNLKFENISGHLTSATSNILENTSEKQIISIKTPVKAFKQCLKEEHFSPTKTLHFLSGNYKKGPKTLKTETTVSSSTEIYEDLMLSDDSDHDYMLVRVSKGKIVSEKSLASVDHNKDVAKIEIKKIKELEEGEISDSD